MNIFVLATGRCGTTTFIQACQAITNYTASHESRIKMVGDRRLDYPPNHIEADNRLSWLLGRLDDRYGKEAFYLHLRRDPVATAQSFAQRRAMGIMRAWREGVLLGGEATQSDLAQALDYIATVEANICHFLRDKPRQMTMDLENASADFRHFWQAIDARGDLETAIATWQIAWNAGPP
jgi:hypothetical protein